MKDEIIQFNNKKGSKKVTLKQIQAKLSKKKLFKRDIKNEGMFSVWK